MALGGRARGFGALVRRQDGRDACRRPHRSHGRPDRRRRALDRVHDGTAKNDVTPWMLDTINAPNAVAAVAADFATQPIAATSIGVLPLPWLKGLKAVRVLADFKPPGMHVAGTLTYAEP